MTARSVPRRLRGERQGSTAVEFAIIAGVMLPLLFGTVDLGLLMWTHNALQSTAALTARCIAIGSSACSANPAQFAVTTAGQWIVPGIINTGQVTINTAATSCNGAAGSLGPFVTVAIVSSYWASGVLPPPFAATNVHVTACFPI
ncbi:MAG TPA: TadE family protein [Rhodopila sp.]|jgi:Flp pilus assembly protein TadG|nr:TadE family protein [Rhodopila sp.]